MATLVNNKRIREAASYHRSDIPEEILLEILLYSTAEDLVNFKPVSKFWYHLISQPNFADAQLIRSRQRLLQEKEIIFTSVTKPTNRVRSYKYSHFSVILKPDYNHPRFKKGIQVPTRRQEKPTPTALHLEASSSDGLLLFQDKYNAAQLYVGNPVTAHLDPLPPIDGGGYHCFHWALVRDTSINKYKVFGVDTQTRIIYLTLGDDVVYWKWLSLGSEEDKHLPLVVMSQLFMFQNELHRVTTDEEDHQECYCIYSVHVGTHNFSKTKIPLDLLKPTERFYLEFTACGGRHLLSEVQGSLCFTFVSHHRLDMFVLKDRLTCEWVKSHSIPLQSLSTRPLCLGNFLSEDICVIAAGGGDCRNLFDVVKIVIHHEDQLLLYDLKTQEFKCIASLDKEQKLCRTYYFHHNTLVTWD